MERDYSHRDVVDKLGIKVGQAVAFDSEIDKVAADLCRRVLAGTGRAAAAADEALDVVLALANRVDDAVEVLRCWKPRLNPAGAIWLLTWKRGHPGYVAQNRLIEAGQLAGMVDNKMCSVSDQLSAMRFVVRRKDRRGPGTRPDDGL